MRVGINDCIQILTELLGIDARRLLAASAMVARGTKRRRSIGP